RCPSSTPIASGARPARRVFRPAGAGEALRDCFSCRSDMASSHTPLGGGQIKLAAGKWVLTAFVVLVNNYSTRPRARCALTAGGPATKGPLQLGVKNTRTRARN